IKSIVKDGKYRLWEANCGREYRTLTRDLHPGSKGIWAGGVCSFSPDGRLLAALGEKDAVLWDLVSGQEVACLRGVRTPLFLPDGSLTTEGGGGLRWPLRTDPHRPGYLKIGPPERVQVRHPRPTNGPFASSKDGRTLAV